MNCYTKSEVREFIKHYLVAALWSSHDYRSEPESSDYDPDAGENMDDSFDPDDLDPRAVAGVRSDCVQFLRECAEADIDLREIGGLEQAGHDFWLTRCGHGAGFWDRGYGPIGKKLSEIARLAGSRDCMAWTETTFGIE